MRAKSVFYFLVSKRDIWEIEKVHGFVPIESTRKRKLDWTGICRGALHGSLGRTALFRS
jgi:hypothetical protein